MKKSRFLALIMVLSLALCLLTACGGGETEQPPEEPTLELEDTFWYDEEFDEYLGFYPDGSVYVYDSFGDSYIDGTFTWDGTAGELDLEGDTYSIALKGDKLDVEGSDGSTTTCKQVDGLPSNEDDGYEYEAVELANTYWIIDDSTWYFYDDGTVDVEDMSGTYDWDGWYGYVNFDGYELEMGHLDGSEDLYMAAEDGDLYLMEYEGFMGGGENESYSLAGDWDNDEAEVSIVFTNDTFTMSSISEVVTGTYVCDGEYFTLTDEYGETAEGYIDSDGDLNLYDLDGYFYLVDEAYYVP